MLKEERNGVVSITVLAREEKFPWSNKSSVFELNISEYCSLLILDCYLILLGQTYLESEDFDIFNIDIVRIKSRKERVPNEKSKM